MVREVAGARANAAEAMEGQTEEQMAPVAVMAALMAVAAVRED